MTRDDDVLLSNRQSAGARNVTWGEAEIARLRDVYAQLGKDGATTVDQLGAELGRYPGNVSRKARLLGLTNPHRPKKEHRKVRRKYATIEELRAAQSAERKAWLAANPHPRGMLGKKHTPETLAVMAEASRAAWANPASGLNTPKQSQRRSDQIVALQAAGKMREKYTRCAGGKRADLGDTYFRSAWEANYARYLVFLKTRGEIADWAYESHTFYFDKIKRGTRFYTPDFKVVFNDGHHEWHEVKGWMDTKSKTRLARMGRYHRAEKIVVIDEKWFRSAKRGGLSAVLPGWESGNRPRGSRGC